VAHSSFRVRASGSLEVEESRAGVGKDTTQACLVCSLRQES